VHCRTYRVSRRERQLPDRADEHRSERARARFARTGRRGHLVIAPPLGGELRADRAGPGPDASVRPAVVITSGGHRCPANGAPVRSVDACRRTPGGSRAPAPADLDVAVRSRRPRRGGGRAGTPAVTTERTGTRRPHGRLLGDIPLAEQAPLVSTVIGFAAGGRGRCSLDEERVERE
jgi:hypothetical protein